MTQTIIELAGQIARLVPAGVIPWACPIPSFGDLERSQVATIGLNPSDQEFVDSQGEELQGGERRFPTLRSLGIPSWDRLSPVQAAEIDRACRSYFYSRPFDRWFRRLDAVVSGINASYYDRFFPACHLDLIPFATRPKWASLDRSQRHALLAGAWETLGILLADSAVRVLVLNGSGVVDQFRMMSGMKLERRVEPSWTLPRQSGRDVVGVSYNGSLEVPSSSGASRHVLVLGYNLNLQSSYGVTRGAVRSWVTEAASESLP